MATKSAILVILLLVTCARCQFASTKAGPQMLCPQLYQKVFKGYIPRGNTSAGTYQEMPDVKTQQECVYSCCIKEDCNVVFMTDNKCYHVICASNELCMPTQILHDETHVSMVLVRPTPGEDSWGDVIINQDLDAMEGYSIGRETGYFGVKHPERYEDLYKDILQMQGTSVDYNTACNVGIPTTCPPDEECVQNREKSRAGTCKCKSGFLRHEDGICKLSLAGISESAINGGVENTMSGVIDANITTPVSKKVVIVKAASKQVKLPDSEVSLQAEVSPPPAEGEQYNYEWTSLHKPDGSNAVKHQNAEVMQLTKLSEGLYTFKVNVSNEHAYGETFVNVTVLPASRINKPPQIVITPANQTIKLPNTGTVLDASSSTDDDAITSYHWELQQGPIGYQPQLVDAPTLQLNDLSRPGNYTFKLTVTDSDKATSVSTANVTVLKFTDYPPEANAGQDTIIYLPHNQITLNGNLSTDDHTITTWEWTKSPDDADKAVDMQNTRTPYLHLSNLEEGMYTFQLKVTDSANQTGTASVLVFVKPPTNKPPVARAGENITMSLPQTWTMVDATNSSDDNKIVLFKWEKLEGPSNVVFANPNASRTNVTGLTKGNYVLKVSVTDDSKNVASALQYITVNQNKNQKPVANAGGDFEVELPRNAIYINGSKSSDDWAIVKWKWTRSDASLAFGRIAEKSDDTPILILTDMVPGRYIFNLSVADEQGLTDTNAVTVVVKNDQRMYYLVDMTVYADVRKISHGQYETLKGKLALLVQDNTKLKVRELKPQPGAEKAIIRFYVEDANGKALNANDVVHHLRNKLKVDASLLGFSVASLQTAICQNNCSGHGVCEEASRKCICEAFWMSDMFKVYFGSAQDSDCSWSILYVVLGVVCGVVAFTGSVWGAIYLCMSRCSCRNSRKPSTYKLIEDTEDLPPYYPRKDISDTDSDSDVVFETRNKNGRFGDSRNGHKPSRNGMPKMGRRIKT